MTPVRVYTEKNAKLHIVTPRRVYTESHQLLPMVTSVTSIHGKQSEIASWEYPKT